MSSSPLFLPSTSTAKSPKKSSSASKSLNPKSPSKSPSASPSEGSSASPSSQSTPASKTPGNTNTPKDPKKVLYVHSDCESRHLITCPDRTCKHSLRECSDVKNYNSEEVTGYTYEIPRSGRKSSLIAGINTPRRRVGYLEFPVGSLSPGWTISVNQSGSFRLVECSREHS